MSGASVETELDVTPVVAALIEKSATGKMTWEATAREDTFVSTIGGQTLKIGLEPTKLMYVLTSPEKISEPVLCLIDEKGKTVWQVYSSQTKEGLWKLYKLAQRIANKVDDRMAALMEALQSL
jgi:hypothetical protein